MFTIQSMMLVSLGFLMALLMAFALAPAYWARAVRLTSERLRSSLPLTEAEIRADKDRLRAQHAIRVHQLETRVESARMSAARQKVEINRRDAAISQLEREVSELNTNLEASENARRVLEHTILDRVPRVEQRLAEARKLLFQRDREMAALQADTSKTFRALDEAMQINAQQRMEIDRLKSSLATRGSRKARGPADPAHDSEIALRSEVEALRARTRDQASLISKLQELVGQGGSGTATSQEREKEVRDQVAQLDVGLANAQTILASVSDNSAAAVSENAETIRELKAANEAQALEIEKLRASLKVLEEGDDGGKSRSLRDSRIALKARVAALEKETDTQSDMIRRLRSELAAANDRSARQAAHHMNELRRLGAGTYPTTVTPSNRAGSAEESHDHPAASSRRSLADRISEKVPAATPDLARTPAQRAAHTGTASSNGSSRSPELVEQLDDSRQNTAGQESDAPDASNDSDRDVAVDDVAAPRRGGLLQRIAGLGKT